MRYLIEDWLEQRQLKKQCEKENRIKRKNLKPRTRKQKCPKRRP